MLILSSLGYFDSPLNVVGIFALLAEGCKASLIYLDFFCVEGKPEIMSTRNPKGLQCLQSRSVSENLEVFGPLPF